jgi:hypothetical protein
MDCPNQIILIDLIIQMQNLKVEKREVHFLLLFSVAQLWPN